MIAWVCDICKQEIIAPEAPVYLTGGKQSRNRQEGGWGDYESFLHLHVHAKCAEKFILWFKDWEQRETKNENPKS